MSKPLSIVRALEALGQKLPSNLLYSRKNHCRAMRKERRASTRLVLNVLLNHMDCRSGKSVRPIKGGQYASLTVAYVASLTKLSTKTVWRVMRDLKDMGYLDVTPQPKAVEVATVSLFVGVFRKLTSAFFADLGLLDLYYADKEYANTRAPLDIVRPVKKKLLSYLSKTATEASSFLTSIGLPSPPYCRE